LSGGVAKNILGNVVGPLAGLASAPILAHGLGVAGRGEVAAATAPFLLVATLATLGIPEAVTYFVARNPTAFHAIRRRAGLILTLAGVAATGVGVLTAPLLAGDQADMVSLISLASLALLPTILVSMLRGLAAGLGLWTTVAVERALGPVVRLVAVAALAASGNLSVLTATVSIVSAPILGGLVYLVRRSALRDGSPGALPSHSDLLSYGGRVWLGSIAGVLLMRVDQVLMVPLSTTYELGLYVVAVTISELPLVINTAIREVMFASDARSSDDRRLTAAARISLLVCALAAVGIGGTSVWWLPVLFGEEFIGALPSLIILLVAVVAGVPGSIAGSGLSARGLPHLRSYSLLAAFTINLVTVILAVPHLGAVGAAIGTLVGNVVSSNINVLQMKSRFGVPFWAFYAVGVRDLKEMLALARRLLKRG